MNRVSLKCANCGNQDLDVEVNYCIPRAIYLVCNKPGCGRITPISFFDTNGKAHGINGKATLQAYEDSYCEDITPQKALESQKKDMKENEKKHNSKSFIQKCLDGEATLFELNNYIDYWHNNDTSTTLREFLGLTPYEYEKWGKSGDSIFIDILECRTKGINMRDV